MGRLITVVVLAAFFGWLLDATKAEVLILLLLLDIGLPKAIRTEVEDG